MREAYTVVARKAIGLSKGKWEGNILKRENVRLYTKSTSFRLEPYGGLW
jgi:hypothetical protein